jgi:hypothetical protein
MTDDNPTPTTRTPIPEPSAAPTDGWPGTTTAAGTAEPAADAGSPFAAPPPVTPPPLEPPPPVASPPRRNERDRGRTASVLFGLVILGLGLWFFVEHTLGYQLPHIRWSEVWPVFLIVLGLWVVLGSMRRGSR